MQGPRAADQTQAKESAQYPVGGGKKPETWRELCPVCVAKSHSLVNEALI